MIKLDWPRQTPERIIRCSLTDPANLNDFLASALPGLVGGFDFNQVESLPVTFFSDDWREREGDLLFRIPYQSQVAVPVAAATQGQTQQGPCTTLVCVLMEHQTNTDRLAPLRTLLVAGGFWERCWRAWENIKPPRPTLELPPVIPIVLYTGDTPWGSLTNLPQLFAGPAELRAWGPTWQPIFWSLASQKVETLLNGGAWMKFMAVMRVENAGYKEFERVFREAVSRLAELRQRDHVRWYELLSIVFGYSLFRRPADQHQQLSAVVEAAVPDRVKEVQTMGQTIAEALMQQGEERRRLRDAREMVREVLEERFGTLSEELIHRIAAATDVDKLRKAHRRAVKIEDPNAIEL